MSNIIEKISDTQTYLREMLNAKNISSFCEMSEEVLEKLHRNVKYEGIENLPANQQGFILAVNHTARQGKVEEDMLSIVGALNRVSKECNRKMHLIMTDTPQPKALFPKNASRQEKLEWFRNGDWVKNPANTLRTFMLWVYKDADDLLISRDWERRRRISPDLLKTKEIIKKGGIVTIFPEGKTTWELENGLKGLGILSKYASSQVVPVAQYYEGNTLIVRFGETIEPIKSDEDYQSFTDMVLYSVAGMLPKDLHGRYAE